MKRITLTLAAVALLWTACGNKQKADGGAAVPDDSTLTAEADAQEPQDTVPPPMHLIVGEKQMLVHYWTELEEPKKSEDDDWFDASHATWALQDRFRHNKAQYTNFIADDNKVIKVKFVEEILEDPDGNMPSIGTIHGNAEIPAAGARYEFADPKQKSEYDGILVTDSYLKSRRLLSIKRESTNDDGNLPPLPASIVSQLAKRYNMKVARSAKTATIDGRYIVGALQFDGEYKNAPKEPEGSFRDYPKALALEVIADGDKVYAEEVLGHYDSNGSTWNVDDEGEYFPCYIDAAFEGPLGLELCYGHSAPESSEVGMFYLRDGKYERRCYASFYMGVDEQVPLWKKDVSEMQRLYKANALESGVGELTRYAHVYIDDDGTPEIWAREASDGRGGALFTRRDGKIELIGVESSRLHASILQSKNGRGYVRISGSQGGPTFDTYVFVLNKSQVVERFYMSECYENVEVAQLNGKDISAERARAYGAELPAKLDYSVYFMDINDDN